MSVFVITATADSKISENDEEDDDDDGGDQDDIIMTMMMMMTIMFYLASHEMQSMSVFVQRMPQLP